MTGGFLGQVQQGRARTPQTRVKPRLVMVTLSICALLTAGLAGAPGVPAPSIPVAGQTQGVAVPAAAVQPAVPVNPQEKGSAADAAGAQDSGLMPTVWDWKGLRVNKILFEGVTFDATDTLPSELTQKVGEPLDPQKVRESTRRLFASGRYRDIAVRGVRQGDEVTLIFAGSPRFYVGRVTIDGVKNDRLASLLEFGAKLSPGTAFTESQIATGSEGGKQILQQQGYYEPTVAVKTETDASGNQVNVTYTVNIGIQARIGTVTVEGTGLGFTTEEFRKKSKLKPNSRVTRDTISNALDRLRKQYQKNNHLEAAVTLQKQTYDPATKKIDYDFHV